MFTSNYVFSTKHYIGIGCLTGATILYFTNKKTYYLFFALTLTVGLIGLLDFYINTYEVGFAGVGINPIFLGLMILFFVVSKNDMDKLLPEKRKQKTRTLDENLIKSFESKFIDKTVAELNGIMNQNSKFTDEARTAAERILKKKNVL